MTSFLFALANISTVSAIAPENIATFVQDGYCATPPEFGSIEYKAPGFVIRHCAAGSGCKFTGFVCQKGVNGAEGKWVPGPKEATIGIIIYIGSAIAAIASIALSVYTYCMRKRKYRQQFEQAEKDKNTIDSLVERLDAIAAKEANQSMAGGAIPEAQAVQQPSAPALPAVLPHHTIIHSHSRVSV